MPHSKPLFTHSTSSMNGHCQAHMSYTFIHKEENRRGGARLENKERISLVGWVTQGTFSFVWRSAYGAKCQQAYLHTVCLCVSLFPLHTVIRRILMERGFISV